MGIGLTRSQWVYYYVLYRTDLCPWEVGTLTLSLTARALVSQAVLTFKPRAVQCLNSSREKLVHNSCTMALSTPRRKSACRLKMLACCVVGRCHDRDSPVTRPLAPLLFHPNLLCDYYLSYLV